MGVDIVNGSMQLLPNEAAARERERDGIGEDVENIDGGSSIVVGGIPSSVYNQSIWTNVADSWDRRFD